MTLQEYIEAGNATQKRIAELVGVTPGRVSHWICGNPVPAKHCVAIEQATEGRVTRYDLRQDIFGAADDRL